MRGVASSLLLIPALLLNGCSAIIVAADVAVSAGVAVVGTAADITVAGVKAVAGTVSSDDEKKK
jgi:hypothetical protein